MRTLDCFIVCYECIIIFAYLLLCWISRENPQDAAFYSYHKSQSKINIFWLDLTKLSNTASACKKTKN